MNTIKQMEATIVKPLEVGISATIPLQPSTRETPHFKFQGHRLDMTESEDPPGTPLADYRKAVVDSVHQALEQSSIVHIDADTGTGMSGFIIPGIVKRLGGQKHVECLHSSFLIPTKAKEIHDFPRGRTIIIDELESPEFGRDPVAFATRVRSFIKQVQATKLIFCTAETEETRNDLALFKTRLTTQEIPQIIIRPKPFNEQQAKEYFTQQIQRGRRISEEEVNKIFDLINQHREELPFHFKWMRIFTRTLKTLYVMQKEGEEINIEDEIIDLLDEYRG